MPSRADPPLHRSPLACLGALGAAACLLGAFGFVVRQGVERGAAMRMEHLAQADAVWRCSASKGAAARAGCVDAHAATRVAGRGPAP